MTIQNSKPGLLPLKLYSGSILLTQYINKLTITGSGVSVQVDSFNGVTLTLSGSGGGGSSISASYATTASYAETASYALRVDGGTF